MKLLAILLLFISFNLFSKEILLTPENTITLRSEVDANSMTQLSQDLISISSKLQEQDIIYLVINSPGGSVFAGSNFIDLYQVVPQKIHSISIFAASMGFMISQYAEKRYVMDNSIMMSHRASGGFQGQFEVGEVESQLGLWKSLVRNFEEYIAKRMGISLEEYKQKIQNELWMYGKEAVKEGAADEVVTVKCSPELIKETTKVTFENFFGSRTETFSKCPLIKFPVKEEENEDAEKTIPFIIER